MFNYKSPTILDDTIESVLVYCGTRQPKIVDRIQPVPIPIMTRHRNKTKTKINKPKLNVITLFIDAMSRPHFHRRLPGTRQALEYLTSPTSPSILYDFSRYHSVGINTTPNTRALWAGLPPSKDSDDSSSPAPIWEDFASSGYTVGRADPMCQDWAAYYSPSHFPDGATSIPPRIAHEHIAFSCLPSIVPIGKSNSGNFKGPASIKARCVSDTHVGWHILDWCSKFIRNYDGKSPYFLNAAFMESHEGSGEVIATLDERLARFFTPGAEEEGIDWNSTVVAVLSDHGALMGLNNAFFENGHTEAKNPFAALIMPRWYTEAGNGERGELLGAAAGELVTPFDFYETLRGLGELEQGPLAERRGRDLSREWIGSRTCKDVGIEESFCRCR